MNFQKPKFENILNAEHDVKAEIRAIEILEALSKDFQPLIMPISSHCSLGGLQEACYITAWKQTRTGIVFRIIFEDTNKLNSLFNSNALLYGSVKPAAFFPLKGFSGGVSNNFEKTEYGMIAANLVLDMDKERLSQFTDGLQEFHTYNMSEVDKEFIPDCLKMRNDYRSAKELQRVKSTISKVTMGVALAVIGASILSLASTRIKKHNDQEACTQLSAGESLLDGNYYVATPHFSANLDGKSLSTDKTFLQSQTGTGAVSPMHMVNYCRDDFNLAIPLETAQQSFRKTALAQAKK